MTAFGKILIACFPSKFTEFAIPDFAMTDFGPMCRLMIPSMALAVSQTITIAKFAWSRTAARKGRCTSRPPNLTASCGRKMKVSRASPQSALSLAGEAGHQTRDSAAERSPHSRVSPASAATNSRTPNSPPYLLSTTAASLNFT